jgi:predicted SnoaL-like aldol condensation-catalyzing enzyme
MKKLFFILSVAASCFLSACNDKSANVGGMSDAARKNLDAFHAVSDAFMSGDISKIDSVVASDFVDHTENGDKNRDSLKAMITMMHKSDKDAKTETKKEFADDEYVMGWMHWTGTSDGSMPGMPAGPYDMTAIQVVRFKDGKAVEHWIFMEPREMMKMMGGGQQMPATSPTSTDKAK